MTPLPIGNLQTQEQQQKWYQTSLLYFTDYFVFSYQSKTLQKDRRQSHIHIWRRCPLVNMLLAKSFEIKWFDPGNDPLKWTQ